MLKLDTTWEEALLDHFDAALEQACSKAPQIRPFWTEVLQSGGGSPAETALELYGLPADELVGFLVSRGGSTLEGRALLAEALLRPLRELSSESGRAFQDSSLLEELLTAWAERGTLPIASEA